MSSSQPLKGEPGQDSTPRRNTAVPTRGGRGGARGGARGGSFAGKRVPMKVENRERQESPSGTSEDGNNQHFSLFTAEREDSVAPEPRSRSFQTTMQDGQSSSFRSDSSPAPSTSRHNVPIKQQPGTSSARPTPRSFAQSRQLNGSPTTPRESFPNSSTFASSSNAPRPAGPRIGLVRPGGRRTHKILRDAITGITKASIRRMARRGGVKRISATVYNEARFALKDRLTELLRLSVTVACHRSKIYNKDGTEKDKSVTVMLQDVIYALRSSGTPIYGYDHYLKNRPSD